jgi:hypothetical protein
MTTIDAIHRCDSDVEVYELLNVYIDAVHLAEHTGSAAPYPLANVIDVVREMRRLFIALGLVSRRLNDDSRIVIKEALSIFNIALDRLRTLAAAREHRNLIHESRRERADTGYMPQHNRRRLDREARCFHA